MAIKKIHLDLIEPVLTKGKRVLTLGYPQLVVPATHTLEDVPLSEDAESKVHQRNNVKVYNGVEFFKKIGVDLTVADVVQWHGFETVIDLNVNPLIDGAPYDIIFDPGTLEHCFNIGNAFACVLRSVKVGGFIVHGNPISMVNHGFWNLNPTAFYDFYESNGAEVLNCSVDEANNAQLQYERVPVGPEFSITTIVRKLEEVPEITWPMQWKYRKKII